ncbi:hypothetical protein PCASD_15400 [Puccinia coronata f. sp. avenae]|uniref:Cation efflux protein cytoplasmic domain-containing protein n=1 Tax=Puccinia coronata f. sp. avenae TaxID=200324 RepID=A0A2N5TZ93_9BASI|nr:hypothetical protein PCASD_15400 [Puccinia coronata f. sp. avenae]
MCSDEDPGKLIMPEIMAPDAIQKLSFTWTGSSSPSLKFNCPGRSSSLLNSPADWIRLKSGRNYTECVASRERAEFMDVVTHPNDGIVRWSRSVLPFIESSGRLDPTEHRPDGVCNRKAATSLRGGFLEIAPNSDPDAFKQKACPGRSMGEAESPRVHTLYGFLDAFGPANAEKNKHSLRCVGCPRRPMVYRMGRRASYANSSLSAGETRKIKILLLINACLFFLEFIVGSSAGSLALMADSFTMLSDVFSLTIDLHVNKLGRKLRSHEYSYGFQRAKVLGSLIKGIFLLVLCCGIGFKAIRRIYEPQEISNSRRLVLVGCLALLSNILSLALSDQDDGLAHASRPSQLNHPHSLPEERHLSPSTDEDVSQLGPAHDQHTPLLIPSPSFLITRRPSLSSISSYSSSSYGSISPKPDRPHSLISDSVHPRATRQSILYSARTQLLHSSSNIRNVLPVQSTIHPQDAHPSMTPFYPHPHIKKNRRTLLHIWEHAIGKIGVILTGLVVRVVPKFAGKDTWFIYVDPAITMVVITIILSSAIPLVKASSRILLQGTPSNISLETVHKLLETICGVISVHELHIWSLSESKLVASVHVWIQNQEDFVSISRHIRKCLHHYGIHSSTIQPELLHEDQVKSLRAMSTTSIVPSPARSRPSSAAIADLPDEPSSSKLIDIGCLQQCDEACDQEACCPPGNIQSRAGASAGDSSSP